MKRSIERILYLAMTLVCLYSVLGCVRYYREKHEEMRWVQEPPETEPVLAGADPYCQQADAILKGQPYLDLSIPDELKNAENPYDPDERTGFWFPWDRAYYEGHYYSYFGVAPVLLFYLPFRIVTGLYPTVLLATFVFAGVSTLLFSWLLIEFSKTVCHKAPGWLLCLSLPCLLSLSGIPTAVCFSDWYYLPVVSALLFSILFWAFLLRGLRAKRRFAAWFAGAAIALTLAVLSRPTAALMCASAFPFMLLWLRCRPVTDRKHGTLAFLIPLSLGALGVMAWNYVRFDSPLEFGAQYQLTISDISENTLDLSLFPYAFRTYFRQRPLYPEGSRLPLLQFVRQTLPNGRFLYNEKVIGACYFPVILLSPVSLLLKRRPIKTATVWWCFATALLSLFTVWVIFCTAGVNLRYLYDFLLPLALCGTVASLEWIGERKLPFRILFGAALACALLYCTVSADKV